MVDTKEAVEIYPMEPRPVTVEANWVVLIPPPGPKAVENEEKLWLMKLVVEINEDVNEAVEIYPLEPRPITVELIGAPKSCPLIVERLIF